MLNIADFEYFGDYGMCKVTDVEIVSEDNKKLVLKGTVKGSIKLAIEQLYQDQNKLIFLNGDSIINYPDLLEKYNISMSPRKAKAVGEY